MSLILLELADVFRLFRLGENAPAVECALVPFANVSFLGDKAVFDLVNTNAMALIFVVLTNIEILISLVETNSASIPKFEGANKSALFFRVDEHTEAMLQTI